MRLIKLVWCWWQGAIVGLVLSFKVIGSDLQDLGSVLERRVDPVCLLGHWHVQYTIHICVLAAYILETCGLLRDVTAVQI